MKKIAIIIGFILISFIGWFLISPLFLDTLVDEALPTEEKANSSKKVDDKVEKNLESNFKTYQGNFVDGDESHHSSGMVKILTVKGKSYLRFENFESTNGPDVFVYLTRIMSCLKILM